MDPIFYGSGALEDPRYAGINDDPEFEAGEGVELDDDEDVDDEQEAADSGLALLFERTAANSAPAARPRLTRGDATRGQISAHPRREARRPRRRSGSGGTRSSGQRATLQYR